jgi:hypothetical protein
MVLGIGAICPSAVREIARERHHQDRQEAEIDLVHPGSSASEEVALGVVDLARTSCSATGGIEPASNSSSTKPPPSKAYERISFRLATPFTCVSTGRTSSRSASSGEMPRSEADVDDRDLDVRRGFLGNAQ